MREKLIELLSSIQDEGRAYGADVTAIISNSQIADHLIANGVTVREKGEWEEYMPYIGYNPNNRSTKKRCSVCKSNASPFTTKFCSNCGADMRGDKHEID